MRRLPSGALSNAHLYSFVRSEWPATKVYLEALIARNPVPLRYLPNGFSTSRLDLRQLGLVDAQALCEVIARNRVNLLPSFPRTSKIVDTTSAERLIADLAHQAAAGAGFSYGIWKRATQDFIGQVHVKNIDWTANCAELGYWIDADHRRRGYASEALATVIEVLTARHGFRRTYVRVLPDNTASSRIALKLGFVREGVLESAFRSGTGVLCDVELLAKVAPLHGPSIAGLDLL